MFLLRRTALIINIWRFNMTDKQYIKKLKAIVNDYSRTDLERNVATSIIDEIENGYHFESYVSDLMQHGCESGMVGGLIYYSDTHKFYDQHYEDIEDLRVEWKKSTGEALQPDEYDLKNWFAWFAYEETVRNLSNELGFDC